MCSTVHSESNTKARIHIGAMMIIFNRTPCEQCYYFLPDLMRGYGYVFPLPLFALHTCNNRPKLGRGNDMHTPKKSGHILKIQENAVHTQTQCAYIYLSLVVVVLYFPSTKALLKLNSGFLDHDRKKNNISEES